VNIQNRNKYSCILNILEIIDIWIDSRRKTNFDWLIGLSQTECVSQWILFMIHSVWLRPVSQSKWIFLFKESIQIFIFSWDKLNVIFNDYYAIRMIYLREWHNQWDNQNYFFFLKSQFKYLFFETNWMCYSMNIIHDKFSLTQTSKPIEISFSF